MGLKRGKVENKMFSEIRLSGSKLKEQNSSWKLFLSSGFHRLPRFLTPNPQIHTGCILAGDKLLLRASLL